MTAAVKKIKGAPNAPANKSGKVPVGLQTKNVAQTKRVAQIKKGASAKKAAQINLAAPSEETILANNLMQMAEIEQAQEIAAVAEVTISTEDRAAAVAAASNSDNIERILLPARMELANLEEAQQLLQSRYPPVHSTYILDGALLCVIDMAGIQMLISFIRSVTAKGTKVEWDNYSVQVYQLASELGVTSQLGD